MSSKIKIALVLVGSLVCGVAAAQPGPDVRAERKAKFEQMHKEKLEKFDANKDGKLDETERAAMHEAMMTSLFTKLDKDGNGVLSLDEFKSAKLGKGKFG